MDGVGVEFDHRGKLMREFKTLWAAVLERAILDLNKKITNRMSVTKKNEVNDAIRSATFWIENDKRDSACSFLWICSVMEVDPKKLRDQIFYNKNMADKK